ncbi:hypothetical protein [Lysinibacter cavernae]|uniref:Uncharacterized protein n=1 Tax=Lysinibacter cavernae TaxID=1640652 RepID=A0A7X5R2W4_9MICO|nr:hypothetical protein [Lysinibacter cavernae]NIH54675.1 hypothetical protein [Lysinibacter cavernae]
MRKTGYVSLSPEGASDLSGPADNLLWVGGTVTLKPDVLWFAANRLNRLLLAAFTGLKGGPHLDFGVGLDAALDIWIHPTSVKKTVVIRLSDGLTVGIRCRGAQDLADAIAAQRQRLSSQNRT